MRTSETTLLPVIVLSGIRVRMRDGVELNLRITRPAADGRYPAVMEYNPYRRLGAIAADDSGYPLVVRYLAERGYVVVQYDLRGTGCSSGFSTDIYSDDERQDGYDMIEWIAAQSWCTGAVGMIGKSYGAVVQWQVAVQNPPHLKAIIVRSANNDVYAEFTNPGGAIRPWMFEYYAPMMNAYNFAPPFAELTGARWASIWAERLEKSAPWSLGYIRNILQGDYWRRRSLAPGFDRVQCPVYLIEGWPDWYASAELEAFQKLRVPRKVLIGPWGHYYAEEREAFPGPRIDTRPEYLRWFDHWLKGIDTGMMDEPPVTVFVRHWRTPSLLTLQDAGEWQNEAAWPPADVQVTAFHFHAQGELSRTTPAEDGADDYEYRASVGLAAGRRGLGSTTPFAMPGDQRADDAYSLLYATPPLDAAMTLLGEPVAVLYVSSTAETAYFHVRLCDVAPDGPVALIADGGLLASHRNSHEVPEPMVPGQVYELRIALRHTAYRIATGHCLRVAISSADFQNAWPTGIAARNTIHRGGAHASRVILPLAASHRRTLAPPSFQDSPHRLPAAGTIERPGYSLTHDLVNDAMTCSLMSSGGANRSVYTVSNRDPARASIDSSCTYTAPHPTLDIRIVTACQTASDTTSYSHDAKVETTVNGRRHFHKSWAESVPRHWS
jgi:uncharacterized protein